MFDARFFAKAVWPDVYEIFVEGKKFFLLILTWIVM